MASDADSSQPPVGGGESSRQLTKAPAVHSSFINKNTSTRKFAPKAVGRRRPAAAAVSATPPTEKSTPNPETRTEQPSAPVEKTIPVDQAATAAAEAASQVVDTVETVHERSAVSESAEAAQVSSQTPEPTAVTSQEGSTRNVPIQEDTQGQPSANAQDIVDVTDEAAPEATSHATSDATSRAPDTATAESGEQPEAEGVDQGSQAQWTAVNDPQGTTHPESAEHTPRKPRPTRRGRASRKSDTVVNEDEGEQELEAAEARPKRKRAVKRNRNDVPAAEGDEAAQAGAEEARPKKKRTPGQKKKKKDKAPHTSAEGEVEERGSGAGNEEGSSSDSEAKVIEPEAFFMEDLASRRYRVGQVSQREKKMRTIDWDEVKQRRREEAERRIGQRGTDQTQVNESLDAALQARNEAAAAASMPRMRMVDGQIVMEAGAGIIDHEADADRAFREMEQVEEDDLTRRMNTHAFIGANKRFAEDRARAINRVGRKWTSDQTEEFYRALTMFGTDFQKISALFPGTTRKSIKNKFVKEERLDPGRIKGALSQEARTPVAYSEYCDMLNRDKEQLLDVKAFEQELAEERERMHALIAEAKAKFEEEQRQRRLAGLVDSEEEGPDGKKKKRKKNKGKQLAWQDEDNVEILEDDGTWSD